MTAVWNTQSYDEVARRMGEPRMAGYLASLAQRLLDVERMIRGADAAAELKAAVHDLASVAGLLGFDEVAARCVAAQRDGLDPQNGALPRLQEALGRARAAIADLDANEGPPPS